ncbi:uncharacterized protein LOC143244617 isoform X2 [Tachypleus tridentatus]|uniref:uncharacterized protein LOC143244617 isoform X2 n=1 Tax=Tachypleus tridentatus TaxID=6853 RepID=UPI003FD196B6
MNYNSQKRCIGVWFLSPVYCIPEVEITLSSVTSNETLTKVQVFLGNMGKIPYFRTRNEAHLLTNEEKEARRREYIKNFQKRHGHQQRLRPSISSLLPQDFLSPSYDNENHIHRGKECVVCLDAVRDSTLLPCFHISMCTKCANMLKKKERYCPVCCEEIKKIGPHYYP